jgi:predicted cupin superfamily sugar epimerase
MSIAGQADEIIERLGLSPHPEGGHYRQTWAAPAGADGRAGATCIYFLLKSGQRSHWHRVDADELWLWHAGDRLTLHISPDAQGPAKSVTLGPDVLAGEVPQALVPKDDWQATEAPETGVHGYTLVSCIVSPGFTFDGFTLAAPDFDIPRAE